MATSRTLLGSLLALSLLGSGVAATVAPPSSAEVKVFKDVGEKKRIKRVTVNHGLYKVHLTVKAYDLSDYYDWFLDTDRSRPGPEYIVAASLETERFGVYDFRGWTGSGAGGDYPLLGAHRCSGEVAISWRRSTQTVTIPRSCLRAVASDSSQPRRVRVNVQADDGYAITDRYPGKRMLSPWVRRGPR